MLLEYLFTLITESSCKMNAAMSLSLSLYFSLYFLSISLSIFSLSLSLSLVSSHSVCHHAQLPSSMTWSNSCCTQKSSISTTSVELKGENVKSAMEKNGIRMSTFSFIQKWAKFLQQLGEIAFPEYKRCTSSLPLFQSSRRTKLFVTTNSFMRRLDWLVGKGGAVANRLRRRTSDQTVLGSNPAVAAALSPWTRLFTPIVPRRSLHIGFY